MDLSGLAEVLYTLLAVTVSAILIVSYIAAAVGARQRTPVLRRTLALSCGWVFGVVVAMVAGWAVLDYIDLLLVPVVGAVVGGTTAFTVARSVTSFITLLEGRRMRKGNE